MNIVSVYSPGADSSADVKITYTDGGFEDKQVWYGVHKRPGHNLFANTSSICDPSAELAVATLSIAAGGGRKYVAELAHVPEDLIE